MTVKLMAMVLVMVMVMLVAVMMNEVGVSNGDGISDDDLD